MLMIDNMFHPFFKFWEGQGPYLLTKKGSKAYESSSERYLTLHIIRHRPFDENNKI